MCLCVVQVLCGRQVFPEEQHDSMPDRLRGGATEGGLCAPYPLTQTWQQEKGGARGSGRKRDLTRACNHTSESTIASCLSPFPNMYISNQTVVQNSHKDVIMAGKGYGSLQQMSMKEVVLYFIFFCDLQMLPFSFWLTRPASEKCLTNSWWC